MRKSVHVIVAEDESFIAMMLAEELVEHGFRVTTACDGLEALAVEARDPADILITDLRMPRLDGNGLITRLRETRPDLPILVLSGYSAAIPAQVPDRLLVLNKPCGFARIVAAVHHLLGSA